ncbi:MAG: cell division protein FtsL [Clostridiales bacterium]|nr:cell division protein FtsL [Clostridiales bacterium]
MKHKRRKSGGISFMTALICIAFVVVAVLCVTRFNNIIVQHERLTEEKARLDAELEELTEKLNVIKAEKTLSNDKSQVEDIARGQLDMVYPGEVIFRTQGE